MSYINDNAKAFSVKTIAAGSNDTIPVCSAVEIENWGTSGDVSVENTKNGRTSTFKIKPQKSKTLSGGAWNLYSMKITNDSNDDCQVIYWEEN